MTVFVQRPVSQTYATLFIVALATLLAAGPTAQAQDVQVPLDEQGEVNVIDAELRERLGLFPEIDGFAEARLFRQGDGDAYELVIRYMEGERQLRERRSLSAAEAETLRRRVSRGLKQERAPGDPRAALQDGRYRFLATTTVLGGYEGLFLAAATATDAESAEVVATLPLLGAAGGFFIPLLLTSDAKVTEGEAALTAYGGQQGFVHGALLSVLVADEDFEARSAAALVGALGAVEATSGFLLARRSYMRAGVAETMAIGGGFGTGLGIATGFLVTGTDVEGDVVQRVVPLAGIAGSVGGAVGGHRLGQWAGYTQGDARVFGTAGLVGVQLAGALLVAADAQLGDDTRLATGTLIGGTLGGLAVGHRMVRDRDFGEGQGSIVSLGAYAGSLAGAAAVNVLAEEEEDDSGFVFTALGSMVGFAGAYFTFDARAGGNDAMDLEIGLGPGATLPGGDGGPLGAVTPALNARLAF
jgi:hypothetical protein